MRYAYSLHFGGKLTPISRAVAKQLRKDFMMRYNRRYMGTAMFIGLSGAKLLVVIETRDDAHNIGE